MGGQNRNRAKAKAKKTHPKGKRPNVVEKKIEVTSLSRGRRR